MALLRALSPALVICDVCRQRDDHSERLAALADPESGALLLRDVCAAADCVELQLRGRLCADHVLDFELAWLHQIPVRACAGCRQSALFLFQEQREVWFVLAPSDEARKSRGVTVRYIDAATLEKRDEMAFQSPVRAAKGKARLRVAASPFSSGSSSAKKRRSARTLQQICDRERLRAIEWSLGNIQVKAMFLWENNAKRAEADKARLAAPEPQPKPPAPEPDARALPEPLTIFCAVPKCRFYAKTGDRCRFHSSVPLHLRLASASAPKLLAS